MNHVREADQIFGYFSISINENCFQSGPVVSHVLAGLDWPLGGSSLMRADYFEGYTGPLNYFGSIILGFQPQVKSECKNCA